MKRIIVTGATGFVGSALSSKLENMNYSLKRVFRDSNKKAVSETDIVVDNINSKTNWSAGLAQADVIVHCAARVHVMNETSIDSLESFREVNTHGTLNLAQQAVASGVKRFIYISSIKVNGESTELGTPFLSDDPSDPSDPYGVSKYEAEMGLLKISRESGMEVVIIRPTLIYGPDVKANFASLLNLVSKGLPLPFGCIKNNKRSLVSIQNLVDLIVVCIDEPKAANQVFLVSDDNDISTSLMIKQMCKALNKPNLMIPIPLWCFSMVGKLFGKQDVVNRLLGSLQVDITHTKKTLGWVPPQSLEDGFRETAEVFLLNKNK